MPRYHVAVDTGGTFSDFVAYCPTSGHVRILKLPSTPRDPEQAVLTGIEELRRSGVAPEEIDFFAHGTTVATNLLLEGRGAPTGLLVTRGFRGIQEVGEQTRVYGAGTYDLGYHRPPPLALQRNTYEISERVDATGTVLHPLRDEDVIAAAAHLRSDGIESVAVCFLFSFLMPDHEHRARDLLLEVDPSFVVSLSCEVLPQIREYPRLSTTLVNASCAPRTTGYLRAMDSGLDAVGVKTRHRYVLQSNGGVTSFPRASSQPVTTLLSGPAGGVSAGVQLGRELGVDRLITFDMGGTSCDVALVEDGNVRLVGRAEVGGHLIAVPMIDMTTVGAGGGTVAWTDASGALHVGPRSAGAIPGPAAYGRGGTEPTVTDANVVLGYVGEQTLLGGKLHLDARLAKQAVERCVATPLGLDVDRSAAGILDIVCARMSDAITSISTARGYDIRDFTLVAFGGAGPLHASAVASALGIPNVLVPPFPGATSALGLLMSDFRRDYVRSKLAALAEETCGDVQRMLDDLSAQAVTELFSDGFAAHDIVLEHGLDLRYEGQGYEVTVPATLPWNPAMVAGIRSGFDAVHQQLFGHFAPDARVEIVSYRVQAHVHLPRLRAAQITVSGNDTEPQRRRCYFPESGGRVDCPIVDRGALVVGAELVGPMIVEQADSTLVLRPGQRANVVAGGSLFVDVGGAR